VLATATSTKQWTWIRDSACVFRKGFNTRTAHSQISNNEQVGNKDGVVLGRLDPVKKKHAHDLERFHISLASFLFIYG
jgi:hypothetical protein